MKQNRNNGIDILKVIFMLVIVLHHSGKMSFILHSGYIAVEAFFMISGFLLMETIKYNKYPSTLDYVKKRLYKLYPHYFLSFVIMNISTTIFRSGAITFNDIVRSLPEMFLVQNIGIFNGGLNYPCWYLSVLLFGSVLIHILGSGLPKKMFNGIAIICVISVYGYIVLTYGKLETFSKVFLFYMPFWRGVAGLFCGCLIFQIIENEYFDRKYLYMAYIGEIILFFTALFLIFIGKTTDIFKIVIISGLLIFSLRSNSLLGKMGECKFMKWLSHYEYAFFLNHAFVISVYNKLVYDHISLPIVFHILNILFVLVGYSMITQKIVESCILLFSKKHREI